MSRASLFIPLGVFAGIVALGMIALFLLDDPKKLPSAMIDRPFPAFELPDLMAPGETVNEEIVGDRIQLVNVWATWCAGCIMEHPELVRIATEEGVPLIGVNYKDDSAKARSWLTRHGNPYEQVVEDREGRLGIDLGVYGAPETFLVDSSGVIRYRHVAPLTPETWNDVFVPLIEALRNERPES